jgi:hypothetical protein
LISISETMRDVSASDSNSRCFPSLITFTRDSR